MNNRFFTLPVIALMVCGMISACGSKKINGEATAYGIVHAHYVGKAVVVVENNFIKSVVFDEMELPYSWAAVTRTNTGTDEKPSYSYKIQGVDIAEADFANQGTAFFAKRIQIGDEVLRLKGATPTRGVYSNENIDGTFGIETWARLDNNAKWYWEQMVAGRYEILKEDGAAYDIDWTRTTPVSNTKGDRWQKTKNAYGGNWVGLDSDKTAGRGWNDNMTAMATFLTDKNPNNLSVQKKGTTKAGNGKDTWEFDSSTGATLTDLSEYFVLASVAFNKVK